jgi:hypothetical protein
MERDYLYINWYVEKPDPKMEYYTSMKRYCYNRLHE